MEKVKSEMRFFCIMPLRATEEAQKSRTTACCPGLMLVTVMARRDAYFFSAIFHSMTKAMSKPAPPPMAGKDAHSLQTA